MWPVPDPKILWTRVKGKKVHCAKKRNPTGTSCRRECSVALRRVLWSRASVTTVSASHASRLCWVHLSVNHCRNAHGTVVFSDIHFAQRRVSDMAGSRTITFWIRNWSHAYRYSCCCWGDALQKGSVVLKRIGRKFGRIVQNNPAKFDLKNNLFFKSIEEVGFFIWRHTFKIHDGISRRKVLPSGECTSSVRRRLPASNSVYGSWSIVHSYLFCFRNLLVSMPVEERLTSSVFGKDTYTVVWVILLTHCVV